MKRGHHSLQDRSQYRSQDSTQDPLQDLIHKIKHARIEDTREKRASPSKKRSREQATYIYSQQDVDIIQKSWRTEELRRLRILEDRHARALLRLENDIRMECEHRMRTMLPPSTNTSYFS